VPPQNSFVEVLTPNVTVFENRITRVKINEDIRVQF
jgi:hypothetical protein